MTEIPVAILAGGRATRLGALTADRPKALMEVAGRPFIDHQLELLRRNGTRNVVLCIGYLGQQIEEHVGDGSQFGLTVSYVYDGPVLQGTAGAIRDASAMLGETCWVLYGDSYLEFDYYAVSEHFASRAEPALMTVFRNEGRWDTSNLAFDGERVTRYDKRAPDQSMNFIDYGAALLRRSAIERIPRSGAADLADLYTELARERSLAGYEISQRFYEIGSVSGLAELDEHLRNG
ncbi:MAG TPA: sugar phosphate nucleotidyltransferase [Chloroflexota bacterium]|jgi:NDP-sugar pyrophosphorylase family protein|nr:sugar phosphate nucleotidyltransferase [Chloroflexota bacterium]